MSPPPSTKNRWALFLVVAVSVFLATMDSSMINVALPSIMRSFDTSLPKAEWVILIYLLTITASLLLWGRIADLLGLKYIFLFGMIVFSIGSIACFLSPTLTHLILFRFVQAIGASMMMATGPAIIRIAFPSGQLGMALGLLGIAISTGLMLGPVLSGILIHSYSWRAIFIVTVPVSLGSCVAGWFLLRSFPTARGSTAQGAVFDWMGMIYWTGMISMAVLLSTHHAGVSANLLLLEGGACIVFLFLLIRTEKTHPEPLFPVTLLQNRSYLIAIFCATLSFMVLFAVLILMPFYLDYVLTLSSKEIGFVMMAVPMFVLIVSPISGFLYNHTGARLLTTSGLTIAACGLLLLCFLTTKSSAFDVAWRLAVLGCGQALFLSPNSTTVLESVPREQTGVSSGMLATARNLGMLAGVSMAGMLFGLIFSQLSGGLDLKNYSPEQAHNFMFALQTTFAVTAVLSIIGAVLSSLRPGKT